LNDTSASDLAGASFALTGPTEKVDPARLPLRGDLAHVRLAGKHFVPHYAVPLAHTVGTQGAELLASIKAEAEVLDHLAASSRFDVLDIAGTWAWGECPQTGLVGYVALDRLSRSEP
jgi:Bacterial dipeptidyl-peptidase Sh3 domain